MNQYVNGKGNLFTNNHILQLAGYLRLWQKEVFTCRKANYFSHFCNN
jgi:hypothetical protein